MVPDAEVLGAWAKKNNVVVIHSIPVTFLLSYLLSSKGGIKDWVNNKQVRALILAEMDTIGKEAQVKNVILLWACRNSSVSLSVAWF